VEGEKALFGGYFVRRRFRIWQIEKVTFIKSK
jgi:hypothetical protein